ncbi:MAG: DNA polymerase III subunit beta [Chloroflexota bacterium]|nr:DNA polymerase III subunit beta [Chloroflexota bacterium]
MKWSCAQSAFSKGLTAVGHAIKGTATQPILGQVLVIADDGRLQLTATSLDMTITYAIEAEVDEPGQGTLPFRLASDFVHALPAGGTVAVSIDRKHVAHIRCGRTEGNLKGLDPRDFPQVPTLETNALARVKPSLLREMIEQVVPAVAADTSRPIFTGVLTHLKTDGSARMVAADGFRLALRDASLDEHPAEELKLLIPGRALVEVGRNLLSDTKGDEHLVEVGLSGNKNHVVFRRANAEVASRLLEGQFPNYEAVLPTETGSVVEIERGALLSAVRSARVFSDRLVRLEFSTGKLRVTAASSDTGENTSEMEAAIDGEDGQISFDVRYLADALSTVATEQVRMEVISPGRPGIFRPTGSTEALHLIMPLAEKAAG